MMTTVELPVEQCLFARLPKPVGNGRTNRQELIYAFEAVLPISIDDVQMSFATEGGDVIACACRISELIDHRAAADSVIPAALPDWIEAHEPDQVRRRLNLLTGSMKPLVHRRREIASLKAVSFVLIAASSLFFFGATRRAATIREDTAHAQRDIRALYDQVLPAETAGASQPDSIRFATRMNQLTATRTGKKDEQPETLIPELAQFLARWPSEARAQVRSIGIDPGGLRIEASLPDNEHASGMLDHCRSDPDWDPASHQVSAMPDRVDLSLQLVRLEQGNPDETE